MTVRDEMLAELKVLREQRKFSALNAKKYLRLHMLFQEQEDLTWEEVDRLLKGEYPTTYITKDKLLPGYLYSVEGRNCDQAIWDGTAFVYLRYKFGDFFLDMEYHWDDGPPYGTVKPIKTIERIPVSMLDPARVSEYLRNYE